MATWKFYGSLNIPRKSKMKILPILLLCLSFISAPAVHAEVGQTNIIDAIATKPGLDEAILLLHQARPWNEESIELFNKKVAFYALALSSGSLIKQKPELQGKPMRIIVLYSETPPLVVADRLKELKDTFSKTNVSFIWGEQKDIAVLATKP